MNPLRPKFTEKTLIGVKYMSQSFKFINYNTGVAIGYNDFQSSGFFKYDPE
jgi:hypothetical protein